MILQNQQSPLAQELGQIMAALNARPEVQLAVLCTEDGLPVNMATAVATQLAAVTGFILATVHQSFALLGLEEGSELLVQKKDGCLVCRSFMAADWQLVLVVIFAQEVSYKRLLTQTISRIKQSVEVVVQT